MGLLASRRLVVYVLAGVIVLGVGGWGLLAGRQDTGESAAVLEPAVGDLAAQSDPDGMPPAAGAAAESGPGRVTTTARQVYVQVLGAVRRPDVYALPMGSRVFEAVEAAGGLAPDANADAVPLAALVADGGRIVVPVRGASPAAGSSPAAGESVPGSSGPGPAVGTPAAGGGPISLSTASLEELDTLPGVGPAIAARIAAFRESNGPFTSVEDLEEVPGIGPAIIERVRDLVVP